ncbi:hypothetical protein TVAG_093630 [Trichomonas vaginalis G3]|uniref:Uncharacterized protein n=1 Tax=Trichomonas vaginalis (strain ATCC PRA-98 / G3) TaxID=412133 RepID=A2DBI6_TRIV3|nr:protein ubiquitination [Trichomonas vaginalis G3]EAY22189.1 hypothetical protein TVAG_093630 [Trichomonas vaginalis G3]KAI5533353.1 protein ubiquitination [Trichomonas vaginalis G3]|eukprot:XP_001583175.1 hypothetical protein [Trichomonas vaginalis G3]
MMPIALNELADTKDSSGYYIIHKAAKDGNLRLVRCFAEYNYNIEIKSNGDYQCTPLIFASREDRLGVVKYLISIGANKEAKDKDGWTSLIWASINGRLEVVKYLISVGANKEAKDNEGKTVFDRGNNDIKNYLSSL